MLVWGDGKTEMRNSIRPVSGAIAFVVTMLFGAASALAIVQLDLTAVGENGQPVPGTTISINMPDGTQLQDDDDDDDGAFLIAIGNGGNYTVVVNIPGQPPERIAFNAPNNANVQINFRAGGRPVVNVRGGDGPSRTSGDFVRPGQTDIILWTDIGFAGWKGFQFSESGDQVSIFEEGGRDTLTKWSLDASIRHHFNGSPLWIEGRVFVLPQGDENILLLPSGSDPNNGSWLNVDEKWGFDALLGWQVLSTENFILSLVGGVNFTRVRGEAFQVSISGDEIIHSGSDNEPDYYNSTWLINPVIGLDGRFPFDNGMALTTQFNLALMQGTTLMAGTMSGNSGIRINANVQASFLIGIAIPLN